MNTSAYYRDRAIEWANAVRGLSEQKRFDAMRRIARENFTTFDNVSYWVRWAEDNTPPPCPDCGRPMTRREPWVCKDCEEWE